MEGLQRSKRGVLRVGVDFPFLVQNRLDLHRAISVCPRGPA
jgi:hypothetical protein